MIQNRYKIESLIFEDESCKIYQCNDTVVNKLVIIKVNSDIRVSKNEYGVAKAMSSTKGFPEVFGEGTHEG